MDLLYDSIPIQFRVVSDPDASSHTAYSFFLPPQYHIPSGKSYSTGKETDYD